MHQERRDREAGISGDTRSGSGVFSRNNSNKSGGSEPDNSTLVGILTTLVNKVRPVVYHVGLIIL